MLPVNCIQKFVIVEESAPFIDKTSKVNKNILSTSYKVSFVESADTANYGVLPPHLHTASDSVTNTSYTNPIPKHHTQT